MLKKLVNEAHLTLQITTTGPLLIRSGRATVSGPDMTPVLTFRNGQEEIFLPGSSLKGVFRSHSEKVICSLKQRVVCYPFFNTEDKEADLQQRKQDYRDSCSHMFSQMGKGNDELRREMEARTDAIYAISCPACRLYGSTGFIGRIAIGDAYLSAGSPTNTEQRDGVGIDRLTGGASYGAKFELKVVSTGVTFETGIHLRNFEIWQLGLLFIVLQDLEDGLIHLGSGRSRGLGKVVAQIKGDESMSSDVKQSGSVILSSMRGSQETEPAQEVWGMGRWLKDQSYGTWNDDALSLDKISVTPKERGIRNQRVFKDDALTQLREKSIDQLIERIHSWPKEQKWKEVVPYSVSAL